MQLLRAMFSPWDGGPAGQLSRDASSVSGAADEPGLYQACVNGPYSELAAFVTASRRLTAAEDGTLVPGSRAASLP